MHISTKTHNKATLNTTDSTVNINLQVTSAVCHDTSYDLINVGLHCWMMILSASTNFPQFMILHTVVFTCCRLLNIGTIILLQQPCTLLAVQEDKTRGPSSG